MRLPYLGVSWGASQTSWLCTWTFCLGPFAGHVSFPICKMVHVVCDVTFSLLSYNFLCFVSFGALASVSRGWVPCQALHLGGEMGRGGWAKVTFLSSWYFCWVASKGQVHVQLREASHPHDGGRDGVA
jgi:hypothetical protein